MGIIEELKNMKTRSEQEIQEETIRLEEAKKREMKEEQMKEEQMRRERRQKILEILNSDDSELDIPYPCIVETKIPMFTDRKIRAEKGHNGIGFETYHIIENYGKRTGTKTEISITGAVVTKREMLLRELLEMYPYDLGVHKEMSSGHIIATEQEGTGVEGLRREEDGKRILEMR